MDRLIGAGVPIGGAGLSPRRGRRASRAWTRGRIGAGRAEGHDGTRRSCERRVQRPVVPPTATSPRRMSAPAPSPAVPRTTSSPPVMPRFAPRRRGAGTSAGVAPRRRASPPDIPSPRRVPGIAAKLEPPAAQVGAGADRRRCRRRARPLARPGPRRSTSVRSPASVALPRVCRRSEEVAERHDPAPRRPTSRRASSAGDQPRSTLPRAPRPVDAAPRSGDRSVSRGRSCPVAAHDLAQMEVVRAELAAVVAGGDRHDARRGRRRRCPARMARAIGGGVECR